MVTSRYIHASWLRSAARSRRPLSRGQAKGGKGFEKLAPHGGNGFEKPHSRGGKGFEKVVRKGSLRFENRHGVALRALEQLEEAAKSFERAIEINSAYEEAYFNFGMLVKESNPGRAEQLLKKAVEHCPDYAAAHRELGGLLIELGQRSEADHHLLRAVELDPSDAWDHVYVANNLWARGDVAAAIAEYELAATLAPERAFPLWTLANVYEDREEWDESRRLYVQALEREPDDAVANMNFGRMLKKKGEKELAKRYLLKALSIDPQYHAARHLLLEL